MSELICYRNEVKADRRPSARPKPDRKRSTMLSVWKLRPATVRVPLSDALFLDRLLISLFRTQLGAKAKAGRITEVKYFSRRSRHLALVFAHFLITD